MMETIKLGARLRAARKAAGFNTSKAFLKKYKVPASTYSQHESGSRTPDDKMLQYYSKIFEINFNWLKSGGGQPFNHSAPSKMNIMEEELFDLNMLKLTKKQPVKQINQKLLTKILSDIIDFRTVIKSKKLISAIVKDAVKIYSNIITHANDNQSHITKTVLTAYKNKYTKE
jgi:transcriptional regulator with XRE-family HTH domain